MPMLMLKCKDCGEVFAGVYMPESSINDSKLKNDSTTSHVCSRGHKNDYLPDDFMDWSGPEAF